jgi:hypothetical protein
MNPIDADTLRARLLSLAKRATVGGLLREADIVNAAAERLSERCSCEIEPERAELESIVREKFPDSTDDQVNEGIAGLRRWHKATDPLKPPPESVGCMRSRDFWHGFAVGWERRSSAEPPVTPDVPKTVIYCEEGHPRVPCAVETHAGIGIAYSRLVCPTCLKVHFDSGTGGE